MIAYGVWFLSGKPVVTVDYVAELNRIACPDDERSNAAPLYHKAAQIYNNSLTSENLPARLLMGENISELTVEQKILVKDWLAENENVFNLIAEGAKKPYYARTYEAGPMIDLLLHELADFRQIVYGLQMRAQFRAEQARYEEAFTNLQTCYVLGQHLKGSKTLPEQLVALAIESKNTPLLRHILGQSTLDPDTLTRLHQNLEKIFSNGNFMINLKAEKLLVYDEIQRCFTESRIGRGHLYYKSIKRFQLLDAERAGLPLVETSFPANAWRDLPHFLFTHPNKQETRKMADRLFNYWEKLSNKSPAQLEAEGINQNEKARGIIKGNTLLEILAQDLRARNRVAHRIKVDIEATLTIIAILRYNLDFGQYPEKLDELVMAGYLKETPMDPWSDRPLVYRKTDDDFILYSTGLNFTDDAGQVHRDDRGRFRQWADEGDAVFWPVRK